MLFSVFLFEEVLEDFSGGDGIEPFFLFFSCEIGGGQFIASLEGGQPFILEVNGDFQLSL